ncbi:MAG: SPW repeat protein [Minisyncoccia bacterium]|jgi:general stress protein CsbA
MIEYWTTLAIGLMMIISPWILGFSDISLAKWCNISLGLILAIASAWKIFGMVSADASSAVEGELPPQKKKRKTKNNVE